MMFFGTKESVQIMDCKLDITESPNIKEAKLVYIHGKGALKKQWMLKPDSYYGSRLLSTYQRQSMWDMMLTV